MACLAGDWARFLQTGSVYDYLNYKAQQALLREDADADRDNGAGAPSGQSGGSGSDPDASDP